MDIYGVIYSDKNISADAKVKATNLLEECGRLLEGQRKDYYKLLFFVEILLGISIIAIGIILLKATSKKLLAYAFMVSGVLSIIGYMFLYYCYVIYM